MRRKSWEVSEAVRVPLLQGEQVSTDVSVGELRRDMAGDAFRPGLDEL
ncbi:hypothetical protein ACQPYK_14440 [Streptosporangium sp. CA-135522]